MRFYAYLWLREDGTPYYAGKGQKDRAFHSDGHGVHRPKDTSRILIFERASEAEALETEKELIRNWGRKDLGTGCLRNRSDGGEIPIHLSPESLKKMSATHKGKHHSPATEFTSETWKGKKRGPQSEEHRRNLSAAKKGVGIGHPDRTRGVNLGNQYAKGTKHTAEWKADRSAQQKQWWAEWRKKRVAIS